MFRRQIATIEIDTVYALTFDNISISVDKSHNYIY